MERLDGLWASSNQLVSGVGDGEIDEMLYHVVHFRLSAICSIDYFNMVKKYNDVSGQAGSSQLPDQKADKFNFDGEKWFLQDLGATFRRRLQTCF